MLSNNTITTSPNTTSGNNTVDYATIIGFCLFALSEIIPLLPIPANGILHSFMIGIHNSFSTTTPTTNIITPTPENPQNNSIKSNITQDIELGNEIRSNNNNNTNICSLCQLDLNEIIEYINHDPEKFKKIKEFIASQNFVSSLS